MEDLDSGGVGRTRWICFDIGNPVDPRLVTKVVEHHVECDHPPLNLVAPNFR